MRFLPALLLLLLPACIPQEFEPSFSSGTTVGGPGKVDFEGAPEDIETEGQYIIRFQGDFYVQERLAVNGYFNMAGLKFENANDSGTMYDFGVGIKPRIYLDDEKVHAIDYALYLGYRLSDLADADSNADGLAVNGGVEYGFRVAERLRVLVELGFISQPAGSVDGQSLTFDPILYFATGVSF